MYTAFKKKNTWETARTFFKKQIEYGTRAKMTCLIKAEHAATQHSNTLESRGRYHEAFSCALTLGSSVCYSGQSVHSGSHYITGPAACKSSQWNTTRVNLWDITDTFGTKYARSARTQMCLLLHCLSVWGAQIAASLLILILSFSCEISLTNPMGKWTVNVRGN